MTAVTSGVPVSGSSMAGVLGSPGEYSHTTAVVGGAETNGRSLVGGTVAPAGHCSVVGQLVGGATLAGAVLAGAVLAGAVLAGANDEAD